MIINELFYLQQWSQSCYKNLLDVKLKLPFCLLPVYTDQQAIIDTLITARPQYKLVSTVQYITVHVYYSPMIERCIILNFMNFNYSNMIINF